MFITHARTPEELAAEVCSDISRRLANIDAQMQSTARSATEKARLAAVGSELADMHRFWSNLQVIRPVRKRT